MTNGLQDAPQQLASSSSSEAREVYMSTHAATGSVCRCCVG